jgi:hypothetical protein
MADLGHPSRIDLAKRRITNILRRHVVATLRTLEQKISDAGPSNQRIDPHLLTTALKELEPRTVIRLDRVGGPWFHLAQTRVQDVDARLRILEPIHTATMAGTFVKRMGQALEIAVFKALQTQTRMDFFGAFSDLNQHDDSSVYSHQEPPAIVSGHRMPGKLDFMVLQGQVIGGVEVKNTRPWIYPDSSEDVVALLKKCCAVNAIPILVARRIHYSTFSALTHCGVIIHQTFNQRYPQADEGLAAQARHKDLLGYHDIRIGNEPDARLIKFIHTNLPTLLPSFRDRFDRFKDLLSAYATGQMPYKEFAARSKRRLRGEPEDGYPPEPPYDDWI